MGFFLAHELLEQTPERSRPERLRALQEHVSVDLALVSLDDLERRIGRRAAPGEGISHRPMVRRAWYFIVFKDGSGALAAGPVNPARPDGVVPIGLLLLLLLLPVIAATVAYRLGRGIQKVERANQALAVGDLSVRVDDDSGPSSELAASFNTMAERIEILIRSRDELVQAVSHELGSPLARLRFHVDLLDNLSEEKRAERVQAMARELDALEELVAELLTCVQSDDLALDCQRFDPSSGLADLAELVGHEAQSPRVVDVELTFAPGLEVFADQRLLLRAVENLLRNAVQHARGRVSLEFSRQAGQISIAVDDDGPGIPEAQRNLVLTPFFRLQADRSRETGGVGLGLAIVDRIIKRHRGHLTISASPLGGARVVTLWPSPAT